MANAAVSRANALAFALPHVPANLSRSSKDCRILGLFASLVFKIIHAPPFDSNEHLYWAHPGHQGKQLFEMESFTFPHVFAISP